MRILIDLTQIPKKKMGVGVYAFNLVDEILKFDNKNFYILLIQNDDVEWITGIKKVEKNNVKIIQVSSILFRFLPARFFLEQIIIPIYLLLYRADIIHSLHYTFPLLTRKKKVVTIHDMTFFVYPEMHKGIKVLVFKKFISLGVKFADSLITVSESTKRDMITYLGKSEQINSKSKVIPLGCSPLYNNLMDKVRYKKTKQKFNIDEKYLLFVGALEPRKNISNLIKACSEILNQDKIILVIVGKEGWYYESIYDIVMQLNLEHKIKFTGFISESEKIDLLRGAEVFIYPSFYEGFGLPVLEAMNCGVPVITSNISSLPEVAGDAAILVNPNDVEQLTYTINLVITSKDLKEEMIEKGYGQAQQFTWKRCAKDTLSVYNSLIKSKAV